MAHKWCVFLPRGHRAGKLIHVQRIDYERLISTKKISKKSVVFQDQRCKFVKTV